ncbi:MAG: hypothetical protein JWO71_1722 [Candidatus Acidoferrum typicum]|nr:hypothetical protein [Candidatus Acidoferrum typicum]
MRVFLSWSGALSQKVALAFREWLPSVIQSLEPYVSSEDIDKGSRWSAELAQELDKSRYGIICLTKENVSKPWINFEAGALSRSIEKTTLVAFSPAVSPFLFDLKSSELEGPFTQFQYVVNERDDIYKLVSSINGKVDVNQLSAEMIDKAFEKWWPELQTALARIAAEVPATVTKTPTRKPEEILDELLELVRAQQRLMISKEDLSSSFGSLRGDIVQALGGSIFGSGLGATGMVNFRSLLGGRGGGFTSEIPGATVLHSGSLPSGSPPSGAGHTAPSVDSQPEPKKASTDKAQ